MLRSLFTGISGLMAHQQKLDVVGNNIANANTVGFKRSRVNFTDTFSQTLRNSFKPAGGASTLVPIQIGLGTKVSSIDRIFEQGNLELTGTNTDLAIQGDAFFITAAGNERLYTRNGAFQVDESGNLISSNGYRVMGLMADQDGALPNISEIGAISLPLGQKIAPEATTEVKFKCNLNATESTSEASLVDINNTAGVTGVSGTAYNGLGGVYDVTVTGEAATQSTFTGTNAMGMELLVTTTFEELGITDFGDLTLTIDGQRDVTIDGLTADTTIGDFISTIQNSSTGVEARLVDGELVINRTYFGNGSDLNVELTEDATTSNILSQVFGTSDVVADDGVDETLVATSIFTTSSGVEMDPVVLELGDMDPLTGQITNITNLGDGGLTVYAPEGLQAGTFQVATTDTNHDTSITIYDSLGSAHTLTMTFTRSEEANTWTWEVDIPFPARSFSGNSGTVVFNNDGSLGSWKFDSGGGSLTFDSGTGSMMDIAFDVGEPGTFNGITQTESSTTTLAIDQDGSPMGVLESLDFLDDGSIQGVYSNGKLKTLAQILLAQFTNPQGLDAVGTSSYQANGSAGSPVIGLPGNTFGSTVQSGYLEMSNTDLSEEFTNMIIAQRGFQASGKVITTSDEMLSDVINLKR